jgi:4-hydroxy-tetrahydrodipicolinate synthase
MELLYTAITTPFIQNEVDYESLLNHVKFLLKNNSGIVLFGTTGECPTLTKDEKITIMDMIVSKVPDNELSKFIIGVGGNNTQECIEMVEYVNFYGFQNIMITTPYYNKPSQDGLYLHFKMISDELYKYNKNGFVMLYNVPGRSIVNISPSTIKKICDSCPNVKAIKEASGSLSQVINIRTQVPNIKIFSGDDGLMVPMMSVGAVGLISVVSNVFPIETHIILKHCENSNFKLAFEEYSKMHKFTEAMFCDTNPVPVKYALALANIYKSADVRLPLTNLSDENKTKVVEAYSYMKNSSKYNYETIIYACK